MKARSIMAAALATMTLASCNVHTPANTTSDDEEFTMINMEDYSESNEDFSQPQTSRNVILTYGSDDVTVTGDTTVMVTKEGANVTLHNEGDGLEITLRGEASDGSLEIHSDKRFKLTLDGIRMQSSNTSAINIQSKAACHLWLPANKDNYLSDAQKPRQEGQEDNATLYSKGQIIVGGIGNLYVASKSEHAISSSKYIVFNGPDIEISESAKDGIHASNFVMLRRGNITIQAAEDCIEAANDGGWFKMTGGTLTAQTNGDASTCLRTGGDIVIDNNEVKLTSTGNLAQTTDSTRSNSASCICANGNMSLTGGKIDIESKGDASKGIEANGDIIISGADVRVKTTGLNVGDAMVGGIVAHGDITISKGNVTVNAMGSGSEGIVAQGNVRVSGGDVNCQTTANAINATTTTSTSKVEISGGNVTAISRNSNGIEVSGDFLMTGGMVICSGQSQNMGLGLKNTQETAKMMMQGGTLLAIGNDGYLPTEAAQTTRIFRMHVKENQTISIVTPTGLPLTKYISDKEFDTATIVFSHAELSDACIAVAR